MKTEKQKNVSGECRAILDRSILLEFRSFLENQPNKLRQQSRSVEIFEISIAHQS